ncbi:MAG: PilW family protein [Candidatus Nitrospinota bacterium M3_3B_026]
MRRLERDTELRARPARRGGFTLIEILVALAIGSLVMAGAVQMFISNRDAFVLLDEMKNMEINSRVAVDYMSRDIRAVSGPPGAWVVMPFDNADAAYAAVRSNLGALDGTDIIEIFTSSCLQPISYPGFNENSAAFPQVPQESLIGCMDCYDYNLNNQEIGDCMAEFNVKVVDPSTGYSCKGDITDQTGWQGATQVNINFNRGNDTANRPQQCNQGGNPNWPAVFTIGEDIYYYVRQDPTDAGNTQLIRERQGGTPEVVANHVDDLQITYGEDTNGDGVVDVWVDGDAVTDVLNIIMARLNIMVRTKGEDPKKAMETPPVLDNSTVGLAPDKRRHRVITRTVMLRNQFYKASGI